MTALKALSCLLSAPVLFPLSPLYLDSFIFGSNAVKWKCKREEEGKGVFPHSQTGGPGFMSPGPRGPANWVWARGGTCLSALHRWCETQPSLHTWNIQILPAASLWSCCNRQGKTERVGGRKQQKQEEEQHTWERTDWHFLRENKQSQVSCVALLQLVVSGETGPSQWWLHLWSLPPLPLTDLNGGASETSPPQCTPLFPLWMETGKQTSSPILLFKFDTISALQTVVW